MSKRKRLDLKADGVTFDDVWRDYAGRHGLDPLNKAGEQFRAFLSGAAFVTVRMELCGYKQRENLSNEITGETLDYVFNNRGDEG